MSWSSQNFDGRWSDMGDDCREVLQVLQIYHDLWSIYSSCLKNFLSIVRFFFLCAAFRFSGSYSKIYQQRRHLNNGSRTSSFNGTGDMSDYARGMIIILHFSKDEFYSKQQARTLSVWQVRWIKLPAGSIDLQSPCLMVQDTAVSTS